MKFKKLKGLAYLLTVGLVMQSTNLPVFAQTEDGLDITIEEDTEAENTDYSEILPGLSADYTFSEEQIEEKLVLADYAAEIIAFDAESNAPVYEEGQVVYLTESEADAELVAEAFGGSLESYSCDVAVINLPKEASVVMAISAAADEDVALPAVWPNYYKELYEYTDPAMLEGNTNFQWQHAFVGDTYAWEVGYKGQDVKVAVLDTGIRNSHKEFAGRLVKHIDATNMELPEATTDVHGHGSHVAGIVAANLDNKTGGSGIAPEASLYMYTVANSGGAINSAAELRAMKHAIAEGVDIVNLSFGSGAYDGNEYQIMQEAYESGIAIFAAAGNSFTNAVCYPASYENVCSVAASKEDGEKASFSNYNSYVDLIFPGANIYSVSSSGDTSYTYKSGTSMSCPVASGVAAVILSGAESLPVFEGKTGTDRVDTLFQVMKEYAKPCVSGNTGAGTTYLPDVFGIVIERADIKPTTPSLSLADKTIINDKETTLEITLPKGDFNEIYYSLDGQTPILKDGKVQNGIPYEGAITIGNSKSVTVKAISVNRISGLSSKAVSATYTFKPALETVSIQPISDNNHLSRSSSLSFRLELTPSFATIAGATWSIEPANQGVTVSSTGKVTATGTAATGSYTLSATALTQTGETYSDSYIIEVAAPETPIKELLFTQKSLTVNAGTTSNILLENLKITDSNSNPGTVKFLSFTSSNPKIASISNDGILTASAPGTTTIKAIACDGSKKETTCKVVVKQLAEEMTIVGSSQLAAGKSITLKANIFPANTTNKNIAWSVDGTGVTIKNGKLTAAKSASGIVTVTATTTDGSDLSDTHVIEILPAPITGIRMTKKATLFTTAGNYHSPTSISLNPEILGGNPDAVMYTSSAPDVAYVDESGMVYAVASGKAKITCQATDGSNKKATCTVTVKVPVSRVTIVAPADNHGYVCVGSSLKLKAQIGTSYGIPQTTKVKWHPAAGDEKLISVSASGVVRPKALKKDETKEVAYVVAEAMDGSGASATFTVTIVHRVKKFVLVTSNNSVVPLYDFANGSSVNIPYDVTIKPRKDVDVGMQGTTVSGVSAFTLRVKEPTTTKNSDQSYTFDSNDGILIDVTVRLQPCNKKKTLTVLLIKTADGKTYIK